MKKFLAGSCVLLAVCTFGRAAEPAFARKPAASSEGGTVKIKFAVNQNTDVAVFIEDAQGKVIRHLAAGVLGANAPAPLQANTLAQTIDWDGKADYGKPATGGPFKVRVALGLGAKYERAYSRPVHFSGRLSLAVGPDGAVYVKHTYGPAGGRWNHSHLLVLNRDGTYRRTLLPFPATPDGAASLGLDTMAIQGRPAPAELVNLTDLYHWLNVPSSCTMAAGKEGSLYVPVSNVGTRPCGIARLSVSGKGCPNGPLVALLDKAQIGELPEFADQGNVALSSDEKNLYISGVRDRRGNMKGVLAAVYKVKLPERTAMEVFFGTPKQPGAGANQLGNQTAGLASDGKGHLLIADPANHRVVVASESDGKQVGEIKVEAPWSVVVHRPSGAVYVATQPKGPAKLFKFNGWKDAQKVSEMLLPRKGSGGDVAALAVDSSASPAVVWVVSTRTGYLARLEDKGTTYDVNEISKDSWSEGYLGLAVDRERQEVYVRNGGFGEHWERFNDENEKTEVVNLPDSRGGGGSGTQIAPGPGGFLYGLKWRHHFRKWDRNGKPVVWEEPRKPAAEEVKVYPEPVPPAGPSTEAFARVGMTEMPHTLGIRWSDGHIFVLEPHMITQGDGGRTFKALHEYLPNGKRVTSVNEPIIWKTSDAVLGPKFDAAGNIYVADVVRPKGWTSPPELRADSASHKQIGAKGEKMIFKYGSIVKFTPKGGMIHFEGTNPYEGQPVLDPSLKVLEAEWGKNETLLPTKLTGAEWIHPGIGHVGIYECNCENVTFDVDEFGRVYFADQCLFQIRVIDTAGNALTTIGGYGNADNCGPASMLVDPQTGQLRPRQPNDLKSPFAEPDIALAWPSGVGATNKHIYIADTVNRRLLRTRVVYAAEETIELKP